MNNENALSALLESAKENGPDLNEEIIKKIYEVQKKYQYDHEQNREYAMNEMEKIIEAFADKLFKKTK